MTLQIGLPFRKLPCFASSSFSPSCSSARVSFVSLRSISNFSAKSKNQKRPNSEMVAPSEVVRSKFLWSG